MAPQIEYAEVQRRLLFACKVLRTLPEKEKQRAYKTYWPATADDPQTSYGYADVIMPRARYTPTQVSECWEVMNWTRGMPHFKFRLIWWRSFDLSFTMIACRLRVERRCSDETARKLYIEAMRDAWMTANSSNRIAL